MLDLHDRLAFFLATDALKETRRANWIYSRQRRETVAEHSWHTLLLAMLFADAAPDGINHNHVRDLLIVHDLVEVYAGDTPLWEDVLQSGAAERELLAGERLMSLLPDDIFPRFDPLWREFQEQKTEEARFARAIDTLHPVIMSWSRGGHGHSNGDITPARLFERKRPTIEAYPHLWGCLLQTVQDAVDCGMLPPDHLVEQGRTAELTPESQDFLGRLEFFLVADQLKNVERGNLILSQPRRETVAEHCWHVSLLGMLLADCAPVDIDSDRVADLLIVHDLVEVYAGDTDIEVYLADPDSVLEREAEAARKLLGLLPAEPRVRFETLIEEFQAQATPEARFARAIDTLHPTMMTWVEGALVHPDRDDAPTSASAVIERKRGMLESYPHLWVLFNRIVRSATDCGRLPPGDLIQRRDR